MQEKEYSKAGELFKRTIDNAKSTNVMNETYRHATYWYAVCAEIQGRYIEAVDWYRLLEATAPILRPESYLREIVCLIRIGSYEEALKVC